jgi:hypothetical protein
MIVCGCRTSLACRGRLHLEWDRTIERSLGEARSSSAGVSWLCVHRWYRMYYHGEWDNARCDVACGTSVQSLGCFQHLFCRWISGKHNRRCICNAWNSENGCFINHPLFCVTFPGVTVRFHPLFVRHRGGLRIFLTRRARSRSNQRPFKVSLACAVCSVSLSVNVQKCWCGVNEGNWQCCGNSSVEPEIR